MKIKLDATLTERATLEIQIEEYEKQLKERRAALSSASPEAADSLARLLKARQVSAAAEKAVLEPLRILNDVEAIQIACEALSILFDLKNLLNRRRGYAR